MISNQATNRRTIHILNAGSHFLPADVISRTGASVSGITYSNYDSNPTTATCLPSPNNSQTPTTTTTTTTEPFTARGELIDPSASLKREDTIVSPPVPSAPRVVPPTFIARGHPVDEVGVRRWRDIIAPPVSYSVVPLPTAAGIPEPVVAAEPVLPTADPIETCEVAEVNPDKAAFQQGEMSQRLERQTEKETFQKEEMVRWTEAAKLDAHSKKTKKSKTKSSRKKK